LLSELTEYVSENVRQPLVTKIAPFKSALCRLAAVDYSQPKIGEVPEIDERLS